MCDPFLIIQECGDWGIGEERPEGEMAIANLLGKSYMSRNLIQVSNLSNCFCTVSVLSESFCEIAGFVRENKQIPK